MREQIKICTIFGILLAASVAYGATWYKTLSVRDSMKVGGSDAADSTAVLDVASTTKGFLAPRMTEAERDAISTPATGLFIFNTDAAAYNVYNGTGWASVGGGSGGGGLSFVTDDNSTFDLSVGDWAAYADAAGTDPVDCTGGSPTTTITRITSGQLRGVGSGRLTRDAANRQGEGSSVAFTIGDGYRSKVMHVKFVYSASAAFDYGSGTAADPSDASVWIYDVTNSQVIQPSTFLLDGSGSYIGTFQTASDSSSYRLCVHQGTTNTAAYTLDFDDFEVGPVNVTRGPPVTDWVSFTPTASWSTNSTWVGEWRRVGDSMQVRANVTTGGAPDASNLNITLPVGYEMDLDKINSGIRDSFGVATLHDTSVRVYAGSVQFNSSTTVRILHAESGNIGIVSHLAPFTFGNTDGVATEFTVPILGWGSNTVVSTEDDGRAVAIEAKVTSTQALNNNVWSYINFDTHSVDTHGAINDAVGAYNAAAGTHATSEWNFTAPVSGNYYVVADALTVGHTAASNLQIAVDVNTVEAVQFREANSLANTAEVSVRTSGVLALNAGDTIEIRSRQRGGSNDALEQQTSISIFKIGSPQTIAATEVISARYSTSTSTSMGTGATTVIPYDTQDFDTHGMYNTGSGVITFPASGKYRIYAVARITGVTANTGDITMLIEETGGTDVLLGPLSSIHDNTQAAATVDGVVEVNAGDQLQVSMFHDNGTNRNLSGSGTANYIVIHRLGGI